MVQKIETRFAPFTMRLDFNNGQEGWPFPVLPESIHMKRAGSGDDYTVIGGRRIRTIGKPELMEIEIESFFPASGSYPFNGPVAYTKKDTYLKSEPPQPQAVEPGMSLLNRLLNQTQASAYGQRPGRRTRSQAVTIIRPDPNGYVADIERWMASGHPLRFTYVGLDPSHVKTKIWKAMSIGSFERWEEAGSPGDVYFKLQLVEYAFYAPIKIRVDIDAQGKAKQVKEQPKREDLRVPETQYKIKAGDTLIRIAMRMYDGDSSRYRDIMQENKITSAGTRTLQIGRVLKIPRP